MRQIDTTSGRSQADFWPDTDPARHGSTDVGWFRRESTPQRQRDLRRTAGIENSQVATRSADHSFERDRSAGMTFERLVEFEGQDFAAFPVRFDGNLAGVLFVEPK